MFRQLNLRSWFTFLSRNRLYTAVNFIGLALALAFVLLVADYTVRQFTVDNYQTKADRIYAVCSEESVTSGYYLQKHLRDRYPEIESSCSVAFFEDSDAGTTPVEIGRQKFLASVLYADTTFFRMFDFTLLEGSREEALAARENVVLSESFARKVFGTFNPLGQTLRVDNDERVYVVSGVMRDIERFLDHSQENVTGEVELTLRPYGYTLVGVQSPLDLMKTDFGEYGEVNKAWTADDVKGFTKILGNQMKIYYNVQARNGKAKK